MLATRDFDMQHDELLRARTANEALQQEAQQRRAKVEESHCNTLQHAATYCNTLQHSFHTATHCNKKLQHTATHCNTVQHVATHCNKVCINNITRRQHLLNLLVYMCMWKCGGVCV